MKILMVMPLFSGLRGIFYDEGQPTGMPSITNLWKGLLKNGEKISVIFSVNERDDDSLKNHNYHLSRYGIDFYILLLPYPRILRMLHTNKLLVSLVPGIYQRIYEFIKLIKIIRSTQPDIVYVDMNRSLAGCLASKLCGIPVVLRAYGTGLIIPKSNSKWGKWAFICKHLFNYIQYRMPYKFLIMTNDGTKGDLVTKLFGVPSNKVKFWMNGVDYRITDNNFSKEDFLSRLNIPINHKVIITVSRLADWKRVDRVIKAAYKVTKEFSEVSFIIVGDGPEYLNLKKLINSLELDSKVKLVGSVTHKNIPHFMQVADIFISVYELSNLCNPVLEAMTYCKCIVSLDDGSLEGLIINEQNGILIKPQKVDTDLPAILIKLLNDENKRHSLGKRANEDIYKKVSIWDQRINKEIELLEMVCLTKKC